MTTVLTFNDIKRFFYTYNRGKQSITFDETYELFDDLNCLNNMTKNEFIKLCESHDLNNDGMMDLNELYNLYSELMKANDDW